MSGLSRRALATLFFSLIFFCASPGGAIAEEGVGTAASTASTANFDALPDLSEAKSENILLRFEIVALGSFPITLFYSDMAFDFYRYYENSWSSSYIPLFNSIVLTDEERWPRLGVALGLSAFVGLLDAVVHLYKVKEAKRQHAPPPESPPAVSPIQSSTPSPEKPSASP